MKRSGLEMEMKMKAQMKLMRRESTKCQGTQRARRKWRQRRRRPLG
jgi:hypothetical protein